MFQLGLDVSTSMIGVCLFKNHKFFMMDKIETGKDKEFFHKADRVNSYIKKLCEDYDITELYIEDIFQSFSRGLSSAKTISQLARFNGIVSFIAYNHTGLTPVYLNVNTCRKTLNIKIVKTEDKKEQVIKWVVKDLRGYKFETKVLSRGKNKGNVVYEKWVNDMADAYVVCKAGIKLSK
jgi:Holliday junction resolvasome RuvABC endonuclease subunit